jgi:hypothetical protein
MAALLAWSGAAFGFSLGLARVFINELHHDNAGGDHNAAVEIAGPVGQDLAGWSLVFCNGSNSRAYATVPLSSALVDEGAGFGTLLAAVSQNTLQNGPDGLALVHAGGVPSNS